MGNGDSGPFAPPVEIQVTFTVDSEETAMQLTRDIVEARLGTFAQVTGPAQSAYWREGRVELATEWCCQIKTTTDGYDALVEQVKQHSSCNTSAIVALPIVEGSTGHLKLEQAETHAT